MGKNQAERKKAKMGIAAISTPHYTGGISVIRISGDDAINIAKTVFKPINERDIAQMSGYTCCYGRVCDGETEIDDGILTVFKAPNSYTGEDVAEISCHGGIYVTNRVLRAVISAGAEPAQAGEFTKRALLNGKLSLTQAEAVMDIISAQGEQYRRCANEAREGAIFRRIKAISDDLLQILGELSAWVDYPEEDIPAVSEENLKNFLEGVLCKINDARNSYDSGRILREGVDTAIVGRPNVGKSTLMNLLSGCERSIVTEIAGTTRDIVEESVRLGEIILRLSDTAGIRETSDLVEGVGVKLAEKKLESSELILAVFDNSQELSGEDISLIERLSGRNAIAVVNKSDLAQSIDVEYIRANFKYMVYISAKDGNGAEDLQRAVEEIFRTSEIDPASGVIANERQKACLDKAALSVEEAVQALNFGETLDAVTVVIDEAANALLELTGEKATEAVVDQVFSHFCVGK